MSEILVDKENVLPSNLDVVIIGGGLSGLSLARTISAKSANTDTTLKWGLFENNSANSRNWKFYLGGPFVHEYGEIASNYLTRRNADTQTPHISGAQYFDASQVGLNNLLSINPLPGKGYIPVPHNILRRSLRSGIEESNIHYETKVKGIIKEADSTKVYTDKGTVDARIVIDCTGWEEKIMRMFRKISPDYQVCSIVGSMMNVTNINPNMLYFLRGMRDNTTNWIFPTSQNTQYTKAEIVAANDLRLSEYNKWCESAEAIFDSMISLYREVGINMSHNGHAVNLHKGGFRTEPSFGRDFEETIFPFGEAAGMNSPEFGQLIDILPQFSDVLAELILNASSTRQWETVGREFFDKCKGESPFSYFVHSLLREGRKIDPTKSILLKKALVKAFTPEERWEIMLKNKLDTAQILKMFVKSPIEMIGWGMANISPTINFIQSRPDLVSSC